MKFKDLVVGDKFTRGDSSLEWIKNEPFTAYGHIKEQNASAKHKAGPWHYDKVPDDEEVNVTFSVVSTINIWC